MAIGSPTGSGYAGEAQMDARTRVGLVGGANSLGNPNAINRSVPRIEAAANQLEQQVKNLYENYNLLENQADRLLGCSPREPATDEKAPAPGLHIARIEYLLGALEFINSRMRGQLHRLNEL